MKKRKKKFVNNEKEKLFIVNIKRKKIIIFSKWLCCNLKISFFFKNKTNFF